MDYAMRSGILAGQAVLAARESGDYSGGQLSGYQQALENSYVLKDMHEFQDAVKLLHNPMMFGAVPNVVCDFGRQFFSVGNEPGIKSRHMMKAAVKRHSSYWDLIKLGAKAARAL
jgi:electron transfer flavoprotein-quinone oxidoreductase